MAPRRGLQACLPTPKRPCGPACGLDVLLILLLVDVILTLGRAELLTLALGVSRTHKQITAVFSLVDQALELFVGDQVIQPDGLACLHLVASV